MSDQQKRQAQPDKSKTNDKEKEGPKVPTCPKCRQSVVHCTCRENELKK